jgi:putative transposase
MRLAKGRKKKGETPSVFRCDKLATHMNPGKISQIKTMLAAWRAAASAMSNLQWNCFYRKGGFDPFYDPATVHRKKGVAVRRTVLQLIHQRFDLPIEQPVEGAKKRLSTMAPGLVDALASLKAQLGFSEVQMVRDQVLGTLNSFLSNRSNEFVQAVLQSSLSDEKHDELRHALFIINRMKAWFDLKRPLQIKDQPISMEIRLLARKIMSSVMKRHRFPRFNRIGMVVDQRIAVLSSSTSSNQFDMWLKLRVAGLKEKRKAAGEKAPDSFLQIPVKSHDHFNDRKGERKLSFQIIEDRETGNISIGIITDVGETFEQSREAYKSIASGPLAMDFGLSTMFATDQGDLLGRDFLRKLKALDDTISGIARHVQRSGQKPRTSKRYVQHVTRARGYIKTELNRVINQLIAVRRPSKLYLERLNFQSPSLSRRMNRILQNCGRSVIQTKLQSIKEEFGIETTEVVSAYTSQTCSCCGYVDKRNRRDQAHFKCLWCGSTSHADVNAARNVGSERFRSLPALRPGFRKAVLDMLVSGHVERNKRRPGSPSDPREDNPYFKDWKPEVRFLTCEAQAEQGKVTRVELNT